MITQLTTGATSAKETSRTSAFQRRFETLKSRFDNNEINAKQLLHGFGWIVNCRTKILISEMAIHLHFSLLCELIWKFILSFSTIAIKISMNILPIDLFLSTFSCYPSFRFDIVYVGIFHVYFFLFEVFLLFLRQFPFRHFSFLRLTPNPNFL